MPHLGLDFLDSIAWAHDRLGLSQVIEEMSIVSIPVAGGVASAVYTVFATVQLIHSAPGVMLNIRQFGFSLPESRAGIERLESFLAAHIVMSFHGTNFVSMGLVGMGYVLTEWCLGPERQRGGYGFL